MRCEIGVIGNGAVGKAVALGFAQAGFQVILLGPSDRAATVRAISPEWDARVFALNHTAKNLLSKLKVWDALDLQRVAPIESMQVFDDAGAALNLDAYAAYQNELAWIVEDQNLNQALDAALRFAPNVQLMTGKTVAMSADFSELTLENGATLQAELWVGADGAQSWLRNQADIGLDYRSYDQRGVVANFSCAKPHHGIAHQWFIGEQGIVALLPLPGQQVSLVWSAPEALAVTLLGETTHQLAQRLARYCGEVLGELVPLPPQRVQAFPLNFISPHSIIGPRLALVGDAAHVVHPLAGHGMNLGFADVVALLQTVAEREAWRSCGDTRVLQRYARARKEDVLLMQLATDGLSRLFGSQLSPLQTVRNMGMTIVNKLPFLKKQLILQAMGK
ncbi:FAD-dependent monooxygenase [Solimicrobium silvestre]|uniref:Ubi-OHases: ubiquinone biosynthesis hydroxylase, UbiH/UbiF/VisC/COQ6 family n=1 Tax=Solimicrobium silvestre TaxID=2099400 RepID=A0A2S9H1U8_9BURK|nr:FAD-dependent monooxygenase [Solimicrobium silvestre]PRC93949.1 Ubi-OHases: ubiquinone biosynthesis hydroxylase, UbiH/UbiF/VisC/COQ6 family [Solimicrobium silvestre]